MKALAVTIIFTAIFALGSLQDVQAQASSSVSYTIVVTEDMLANRTGDDGMRMQDHKFESREQAPHSSVSVRLQGKGFDDVQTQAFETEMSPENAPAIAGMLEEGFTPVEAEKSVADMQTERIKEDDGEYLVVMEFN